VNPDPTLTTGPLSPGQVRAATFTRTPIGRRGVDEDEVVRYLDRLADEIATRDDAIGRLMHENRKLRHALREWHRDMIGYDGVDLVTLAQQQVEEQIAQTDAYSRQREEEAARLYDEIVAEACEEAERRFGEALSGDLQEQTARQRTLVLALLQSLEAFATQLDATRQTFGAELDKLQISPRRGGS
jgi:DivIVA domain-containing protein